MPAPTITTLPEAPSIADPANFPAEASAHVASLTTFVTEVNAFGDYLDGNGFGNESTSFRNLVDNGDMRVAQRGASATGVTTTSTGAYHTCDRWKLTALTLGTWTVTQDTTGPAGFGNSYKLLCTTADAAPAAADALIVSQSLIGRNLQRLTKGLAGAKSVTLGFSVKSNVTGTYVCELYDLDNTRHIAATYTISAADTWTPLTLTFAGDTTGAFDNDTAASLNLRFWLGAGSNFTSGTLATTWAAVVNANSAAGQVNLGAAVNNYWQITGVQLEAGAAATEFENMPFDIQEARCFPYCFAAPAFAEGRFASGYANNSTIADVIVHFPTKMNSVPTLTTSATAGDYSVQYGTTTAACSAVPTLRPSSRLTAAVRMSVASGLTGGQGVLGYFTNANGKLVFEAEV